MGLNSGPTIPGSFPAPSPASISGGWCENVINTCPQMGSRGSVLGAAFFFFFFLLILFEEAQSPSLSNLRFARGPSFPPTPGVGRYPSHR